MTALRNDVAASQPAFIDILLDETGSMESCIGATILGFDEFVADQKKQPGACYLTLSKFDSGEIKTPYVNLPLEAVPGLSFFPRGGTNLYDVVGDRLTAIMEKPRPGRTLVVIITDGSDNQSRRFTASTVSTLVAKALNSGISVRYYGAAANAKQVGLSMGIPEQYIETFNTSNMRDTMRGMSASTTAFRAA